MSSEIRTRSGWGEYHEYIGDALLCCLDYAGRLQRSLAGEIALDRHYFLEKADELQHWATNLVERCEEVEGWIRGNKIASADGDLP